LAHGPLGFLGLLYTPTAIVIAQFVIAVPIVTGLTAGGGPSDSGGVPAADARARRVARSAAVGALVEARLPMLAALMAGFGGVISEVGASMMVGGRSVGNIKAAPRKPSRSYLP
jgi:tungstate transport system permease protein